MTARILVVDDEPDMETLLVQKFRRQIGDGSVQLLFARDGVEALDLLASDGSLDMVITDINMPRMDGLTLLQKLQETDERLSTVIVSAYGDMANIRTAMNRGAFDFVTKPIDFSDLEATIAKTIRHVENLRDARRRQAEAERAYASLSRYFSPNLVQRLSADDDAIDLAGQRREIASLFTDIAGFTGLVETLEPSVLGPLLNEYLTGMTDIVFSHDGTVAKIVGDALHVLFGAPGEQDDHSARAVACALDLDEYAVSFQQSCRKKEIVLGVTRIGAHAGPAIVGNFGGGRFFDYTAYGDTVNVAARLEAANKFFGSHVCVSSGEESQRLLRTADRRSPAAGQDGSDARIRALAEEKIRERGDEELPRSICQTRIGRRGCDGGICGACRQLSGRPACQLSPQAAPERGKGHANCVAIMRPRSPVMRLFFPLKLEKMAPHSHRNPLR
jgi:adenylate cyclase